MHLLRILYWPTSIAVNGFLNNMIISAANGGGASGAFIEATSIESNCIKDICSGGVCTGADTCSGDV